MLLCLHCFYLGKEATFCPGCGRTYACCLCRNCRHKNPVTARYCGQCGTDDLSEPVRFYLQLRWVTQGSAILLLLVGLRLMWQHLCWILCTIWHTSLTAIGLVFSTHPRVVERNAMELLHLLLVVFILSWFLPRETGAKLRRGLLGALRTFLRWTWQSALFLWKRLINAGRHPNGQR